MSTVNNNNDHVFSVFQEPGFIIFKVDGISIKLPVDQGNISEMHDKSESFLKDLFSIGGVEEVFRKYGVVLDMEKELVHS